MGRLVGRSPVTLVLVSVGVALTIAVGAWFGEWVWRLPSRSRLIAGASRAALLAGVAGDPTQILGSIPNLAALPPPVLDALGLTDSGCALRPTEVRSDDVARAASSVYRMAGGSRRPSVRLANVAMLEFAIRLKYSPPQRAALYLALLDLGEPGDIEQTCQGMFGKTCSDLGLEESAVLALWRQERERATSARDFQTAVASATEDLARRCCKTMPVLLRVELTPRGSWPPRIRLRERVDER